MNRVNRARDAHFGILLILFAGIAVTSCGRASQDPIELRVMSYNIAAGFGDIYGIAEVIAEQQPDLVALQEVDVHWGERSYFEDQVRFLERKLNMNSYFGEIYSFESEAEGDPPRQFGLAILSKPVIKDQNNHLLSRLSTQSPDQRLTKLPGFPEITLEVDGTTLHFFNTHLDYRGDPAIRIAQVEETLQILESITGPAILAGDLNARPGADELQPLFSRLSDVWAVNDSEKEPGYTFPSDQPDRRIDYILHSGQFQVKRAFTVDTQASDHLPVVADLLLSRK